MLSRVRVQNFKCFRDISLSFKELTVMVGGNGVGKSTIIQSLLLYKSSLDSYFLFSSADGHQFIINDNSFDVALNGPYLLQLGQSSDVICSQADLSQILLSFYNEDSAELKFIYELDEKFASHLLCGNISKPFKRDDYKNGIPLGGTLGYLNAERLGPRKALVLPPNSKLDVGWQGEFTPFTIYKADHERIEINQKLQLTQSARFSHQVEAWLSAIIPNQEFDYNIVEDVNAISLKYRNNLLDTNFLLSTNTGFGISYVLPIIVEGLLLSNTDNSVFIVENPEAHLNPLGQSRIGRFLARLALSGVQVIIETHSEHVTNGARIEFALEKKSEKMITHYFEQKGDKVVVEEIAINSFGEFTKWPSGFFDQEKLDLKELFKLKRGSRI